VIRQPGSPDDAAQWTSAIRAGDAELRGGRVAVITVAGGQGTRLGFDYPKGLFPIGPVSDRSLFQVFAEQILARRRRHQAEIPWFIMTSDATHDETVAFFESRKYFSLPETSVVFFKQGSLPAVDAATGKLLLSSPASLALSPDGHGGLVMALQNAGLLNRMQRDGIESVFYHQVDNPTVIIADPALIGFHTQHNSLLTTNVVCKSSPTERMGVLVDLDGHTEIIEYSELTPEQAARCDAQGQWIFWAGNTAIHVFDRTFLQRLAEDGCRLPLHVAHKNVAYLDANGQLVLPTDAANPNAIKFERFIFDALPLAERTLIVEGNRDREFNPVKNKSGADSADTSRAALRRIAQEWLQAAGHSVPEDQPIEISPLQALDADELKERLSAGTLRLSDLTPQP
jgi:UDP-N-acetylglucosamine/UDP-N-acetylgalactosamine diphosphorylase